MTHAEQYANSLPDVFGLADPILLPRTAHLIGTLFAAAGGIVGSVGWPAGIGIGAAVGAGIGYGAYWAVEKVATWQSRKRGAVIEATIIENFILRRGDDSRPLSLEELLQMRRACM